MRINIATDRSLIRAGAGSTRYLRVAFALPERPRVRPRDPLALALVLDRSGSMGDGKLELARQAADRCLGLLSASDHSSLVVFDDVVDVLQSLEPVTTAGRNTALGRLGEVQPRGSTDLGAGWLAGAEQAGRGVTLGANARVLLLTDGLANHGITEPATLTGLAHELRARRVTTSTFGVGADFDERLLEGMAEAGGGNFYYLERPEALLELLTRELSDAMDIVAHEAILTLDLPEGISVEVPAGWMVERRRNRVRVALGDLVSGQEMDLVLALRFPRGTVGRTVEARVRFSDREGAVDATEPVMAWTWESHEANDGQPTDQSVNRAVAQAYAAKARREAAELNRAGAFSDARHLLEATARRISGYAGDDVELQQLAIQLANEARDHARHLAAAELKARHFRAYASRKHRDEAGRSRRSH